MASGFLFAGLLLVALALSLAATAAFAANVYLRGGPRVGLSFLALLGLAGTLILGGEVVIPLVVLAAALVAGGTRGWSFERTLWTSFALVGGASTALWIFLFAHDGAAALAPYWAGFEELIESLRSAQAQTGLSEIDAAALAGELARTGIWWVAAVPGLSVGGDFLMVWFALVLLAAVRRSLWNREEILTWRVPWPLVWVLLIAGFGAVAVTAGWASARPMGPVRVGAASGLALAATWFLVQGFLVGLAALERWRIPKWLGVPALILLWRLLIVVGVADLWAGFRGRLAGPRPAEDSE